MFTPIVKNKALRFFAFNNNSIGVFLFVCNREVENDAIVTDLMMNTMGIIPTTTTKWSQRRRARLLC